MKEVKTTLKVEQPSTIIDVDGTERNFSSKSKMFVWLYEVAGMSVGDISAFTQNHYSFVHGRIQEAGILEKKENTESRSGQMRRMSDEGLTPGQIAKELNANYSFVFGVIKKYKASKEIAQ